MGDVTFWIKKGEGETRMRTANVIDGPDPVWGQDKVEVRAEWVAFDFVKEVVARENQVGFRVKGWDSIESHMGPARGWNQTCTWKGLGEVVGH
jgi:hypothetical protein